MFDPNVIEEWIANMEGRSKKVVDEASGLQNEIQALRGMFEAADSAPGHDAREVAAEAARSLAEGLRRDRMQAEDDRSLHGFEVGDLVYHVDAEKTPVNLCQITNLNDDGSVDVVAVGRGALEGEGADGVSVREIVKREDGEQEDPSSAERARLAKRVRLNGFFITGEEMRAILEYECESYELKRDGDGDDWPLPRLLVDASYGGRVTRHELLSDDEGGIIRNREVPLTEGGG